jgi:3-oxoacyl-[acyl-carrier protein] reductase
MKRLEGKTAIVTGAASGFGRATTHAFLREGAAVVGVDLDEGRLGDLRAEAGADAALATLAGDVCDRDAIVAATGLARERFGGLDVYLNNAGKALAATPSEQVSDADWEDIMRINLTSIHVATTVVLPIFRAAGGGSFLITASMAGVRPRPNQSPYTASKAGAIAYGQGLAIEVATENIRVNVLCPLAANTPMLAKFGIGDHAEAERRMIATTPMERLCELEDVAEAACFLASDAASFITGVALPIDGGRHI